MSRIRANVRETADSRKRKVAARTRKCAAPEARLRSRRSDYVLPRRRRVRYRSGKRMIGRTAMRSRMIPFTGAATVALIIAGSLSGPAAAQSVAEFYAGKQISLLVGASAGGGYDHL